MKSVSLLYLRSLSNLFVYHFSGSEFKYPIFFNNTSKIDKLEKTQLDYKKIKNFIKGFSQNKISDFKYSFIKFQKDIAENNLESIKNYSNLNFFTKLEEQLNSIHFNEENIFIMPQEFEKIKIRPIMQKIQVVLETAFNLKNPHKYFDLKNGLAYGEIVVKQNSEIKGLLKLSSYNFFLMLRFESNFLKIIDKKNLKSENIQILKDTKEVSNKQNKGISNIEIHYILYKAIQETSFEKHQRTLQSVFDTPRFILDFYRNSELEMKFKDWIIWDVDNSIE